MSNIFLFLHGEIILWCMRVHHRRLIRLSAESNIRAIVTFTVDERLKSKLPDVMKLSIESIQSQYDYSNEGGQLVFGTDHDERTWLRLSMKKSNQYIDLAPHEEA